MSFAKFLVPLKNGYRQAEILTGNRLKATYLAGDGVYACKAVISRSRRMVSNEYDKGESTKIMRQTSSDIAIGVGLLLFCGFAAWRTTKIRVPPEATIAGTSFLPWLMIGGIALLSVILIARARLHVGSSETVQVPNRLTFGKIVLFTLVMVAYGAGFMTVGYIPSTLVVFVIGLLLFKERRIAVLIIFPLVMTGAIYLGFTRFLGVWLP